MRLLLASTLALVTAAVLSCSTTPEAGPAAETDARGETTAAAEVEIPSGERIQRAERDFEVGRELTAEGRHAEALPHFEAAARGYPQWALAHLEEARCRMVLNQSEQEIGPPLERALELASSNPRVHYAWGLFHENFGRDGEARQSYRRAVTLRATYSEALFRLALLEEVGGAKRAARDYFERACASDPNNVAAVLGAARLAEATGDAKRSEALLRRLVRQDPGNLSYKRKLVELFRRTGQHGKARRLQAAIDRAATDRERKLRPLKPSRR